MARKSPAQKLQRITRAIEAWETYAPNSVFFGMTLEQFKAAARPSVQLQEEIDDARRRLKILVRKREVAHGKFMPQVEGVSFGIKGDPKFGQDSLLYARIGYVRKSARRKRRKKH